MFSSDINRTERDTKAEQTRRGGCVQDTCLKTQFRTGGLKHTLSTPILSHFFLTKKNLSSLGVFFLSDYRYPLTNSILYF